MARVISCSATTEQVIARTKTQTRRRGWWTDKKGRRLVLPGDQLQIVDKAMGLAGISDEEARRRCADGIYPGAFKRGRRWRIPASALTSAGSV